MSKSELNSIKNEYELNKLLDFYHPEIYSFKMQHSLLQNEGIVIEDLTSSVSNFLLKTQKIKIVKITSIIAMFDNVNSSFIKFHNKADNLLVFDDDVIELTFIDKNGKINVTGNLELLQTPLNQVFIKDTIGEVKVRIKGKYRNKLFDIFSQGQEKIYTSYKAKALFSYNLEQLFHNRSNNSRDINDVIKERLTLLGIYFHGDFNWEITNSKTSLVKNSKKVSEFLINNHLSDQMICQSRNCLRIIKFNDSFKTNSSNNEIKKQCDSVESYERHLLKFVKKIIYLSKLSLKTLK